MRSDAESAVVDALYRGACDDGELSRAITMLAEAFDCPAALMGDVDEAEPNKNCLVGGGLMDAEQLHRCGRFVHLDPAPHAFLRLRPGTARTTHRVLKDIPLKRGEFYQEFLRPLTIDHAVASPLHASGTRFSIIALHQVRGRRILDDGDAVQLQRLTPHLARVLRARRAFLDLRNRQTAYAAIVDASPTGLIGLTPNGSVLFVNPAMLALAAQGDGLKLDRHGLLVLADRSASRSLARLRADVSSGGAGGYVRIPRPSRRMPFILSASRLPVHDEMLPRGGTLLAVVDPIRRQIPREARIAELLGLTKGSAKVLQALLSGDDLKSYADRARLTVSTVRTHLKAAFARTETHSQIELVRLALAILNDFDQLEL